MNDLSARRPLKSRGSRWASGLSRGMLRLGIRPNQVSVMGTVFAAGSATCLLLISCGCVPPVLLWVLALVGIQLRLICNLMDGMLAVEGGLKTPNGDLYNEFPDRLSDPLILASLGYAGGTEISTTLGWLCATGALTTACIRMHGASLIGTHDFRGPMAKPQRMALATAACLAMAILAATNSTINPLPWILGVMLVGIIITIFRRLLHLSRKLRDKAAKETFSSHD